MTPWLIISSGCQRQHHEGKRRRADDQRAKDRGIDRHDGHRGDERARWRQSPFAHRYGEQIANAAIDARRPQGDEPRLIHEERDAQRAA
jgi:hypothetical protein